MEVEGEPEVKKRYKKFDLVVVTESFGLKKVQRKTEGYVSKGDERKKRRE